MSTFQNLAPEEAIKQLASPPPVGFGVMNPPSVANLMSRMGISPIPVVKSLMGPKAKVLSNALAGDGVGGDPMSTGSFVSLKRQPFALTCQSWIEQGRYIYCRVNPRSVQWTETLRVSDQLTLSGTVQHAWRPQAGFPRRTYYSEPKLTITFQSGNTMAVRPNQDLYGNAPAPGLPQGLRNFYEFKALMGESRLAPARDAKGNEIAGGRVANVVYIMYTSRTLPSMVLCGLFSPEGLSWTDNAEDPNKIEWTSSFTVYDSYPRFDSAAGLIAAWDAASHPSGVARSTAAPAPVPAAPPPTFPSTKRGPQP